MPEWPTLPAGAGYPLVDAETGEFLSDAVNEALLESFVGNGAQLIDVRTYGSLASGTGAADANTATINAAIASTDGDIFIPWGIWYITPDSITVPAGRRIFGARSSRYAGGDPTKGTRLKTTATAGNWLIQLGTSAALSDLALIGAGGATTVDGIRMGTASTVERVTVTGHRDGISGDYAGACTVRDVNCYSNTRIGLRDLVDSAIVDGFYNANGEQGMVFGSGANDNTIRPTKVEFNGTHGILIFDSNDNNVSSIFDRNGDAGVRVSGTTGTRIEGTFKRNGRFASGDDVNDTHLYIEDNDSLTLGPIVTETGEDDGGGGYLSPKFCTLEYNNTDLKILGGDFSGCTDATRRRYSLGGNTGTTVVGATGVASIAQGQMACLGMKEGGVSDGATLVLAVPHPSVDGYNQGDPFTIDVTTRDGGSGTRSVGTVPALVVRDGGGASVSLGTVVDLFGTEVGNTVTIAAAASTDGTTVTVTVTNSTGSDRTVRIRVH